MVNDEPESAQEQDRSTLVEIFKYPGFSDEHTTPLPFRVALEAEVMRHVLSKQYTRARQVNTFDVVLNILSVVRCLGATHSTVDSTLLLLSNQSAHLGKIRFLDRRHADFPCKCIGHLLVDIPRHLPKST